MTENATDTNKVARTAASLGISLDYWAVGLALLFALLIWSGVIKSIPW